MSEIGREQTGGQARSNTWVMEHRDLQATAISVDWHGNWVLLAGRRHLALQKVGNGEDNCLRRYHRNSKYDVSSAEWSICQNSQEYCAIATSQLIEVVTWSSGDPTLIHSLRAHNRMVTDIDWHSKEPHLLASCSIDTFTHLWDLRDPRKPTLSLSAVCMSGATQVGFNRVSGNLLATAHDGDLRVWDIRKGSCPIQYITAHLARIHGINWSHVNETHLTTASQDGSVKYFDVNNPRRAEKIITMNSPVWRARYTPIGNGLVTIVVPHLGRGENSLLLWSNTRQTEPICSFIGHTDVVLDFAYKPSRDDNNAHEIEFFTWSRDQTLRFWKIDENLLRCCEPPNAEFDEEGILLEPSSFITNRQKGPDNFGKSINDQPTCSFSLQHEFSLLNTNIPHIDFEVLDPLKRNAIVRVTVNVHVIVLQVKFPQEYPSQNVPPEFVYCSGTTVDDTLAIGLMKVLRTCALPRVKKSRTCLEQCLRALVTALNKLSGGGAEKTQLRLQSPRLEGALSSALHDACIPFPKTSGARFNNAGLLIAFSQPLNTKRISLRHHTTTPRALSAINGYLGNVMGSQPVLYAHRDSSTSSFYIQDRMRKTPRNLSLQKPTFNTVVGIYDVKKILSINKELAEHYILNKGDIVETCRHNKKVAETFGRPDLAQVWNLAEMIANTSFYAENDEIEVLNDHNPFKRMLLESIIIHFAKNNDIQTAVMLCCSFDKYPDPKQSNNNLALSAVKGLNKSPPISPYHTIIAADFTQKDRPGNLAHQLKQIRSNSWSDSVNFLDLHFLSSPDHSNSPLLRKSQKQLFDTFKKVYAEILYLWGLLPARAMILKHLSFSSETPRLDIFATECRVCNRVNLTPSCGYCHKTLLYCSLCRLPIRGAASACLLCGHGGHSLHLKQWFKNHDVCASGCGCHCLRDCAVLLNDF